jgi:hypothetical protein
VRDTRFRAAVRHRTPGSARHARRYRSARLTNRSAGRRAFSPAAPVTRRYAVGSVSTEATAIDPVPAGPALGSPWAADPGLDAGQQPPTATSCAGTLVVAMADRQRTARHGRHRFDQSFVAAGRRGLPDGGSTRFYGGSTRWQGHRGRIAGGARAADGSGRLSPRCPEDGVSGCGCRSPPLARDAVPAVAFVVSAGHRIVLCSRSAPPPPPGRRDAGPADPFRVSLDW